MKQEAPSSKPTFFLFVIFWTKSSTKLDLDRGNKHRSGVSGFGFLFCAHLSKQEDCGGGLSALDVAGGEGQGLHRQRAKARAGDSHVRGNARA